MTRPCSADHPGEMLAVSPVFLSERSPRRSGRIRKASRGGRRGCSQEALLQAMGHKFRVNWVGRMMKELPPRPCFHARCPRPSPPSAWQIAWTTADLMGDQDDGHPSPSLISLSKLQDRDGGLRVQGGSGFIAKQHLVGSVARARAMPTRCFCPPQSWAG